MTECTSSEGVVWEQWWIEVRECQELIKLAVGFSGLLRPRARPPSFHRFPRLQSPVSIFLPSWRIGGALFLAPLLHMLLHLYVTFSQSPIKCWATLKCKFLPLAHHHRSVTTYGYFLMRRMIKIKIYSLWGFGKLFSNELHSSSMSESIHHKKKHNNNNHNH